MMMRVGVVFDNSIRPDTTGVYCLRALSELASAGQIVTLEHLSPRDLRDSALEKHDLWIVIDDGLDYDLPERTPPIAWWAIDTHLSFGRCLKMAQRSTWTFCAQANGTSLLNDAGVHATWLPLACDPEIHGQRSTSRSRDIAFVGNWIGEERVRLLQLIHGRYPNSYIGRACFENMAEIYSSAKIGFNRSVADDVNMRVFEVLCSGTMLLTNRIDGGGLSDLLKEGKQYIEYTSDDELLDRLVYFLRNDIEREKIAAAGRAEVLARHTYRHRMEVILGAVRTQKTVITPAVIEGKSDEYFEFDRPEVLDLIPLESRKVLDVGCGSGRLGAAIKKRQGAHVTGVEIHSKAAIRAKENLDDVVLQNVESSNVNFGPAKFDCVVCADVLEHLCEPSKVLKKLHYWLTERGSIVASIPNVRNHSVVSSLLAGNWTYEPAGILDADHKQFFTRREIEKLFFRSGFKIQELRMVPGDGFEAWHSSGRPQEVKIGPLSFHASSQEESIEFFVYQYLVHAKKYVRTEYPLTSIVIVTHNQQAYTRQCIQSIQMRTDEEYEFVLIDNGSTDGTPEYLKSVLGAKVICNTSNRGFPAAVNQGLEIASGKQILLLNNDVIVTTGWLTRLLEALYLDAQTGLVGPVSNNVSGYQQVPVDYHQLSDLDGAAWDCHSRQATSQETCQDVDRLVGFCLLLKREVVDAIGFLDERFGVGNFEDDDYVRRARNAGYRALIAKNSFVHHFGSVTFRGAGVDFAGLLARNQQIYANKWGQKGEASEDVNEHTLISAKSGPECFPLKRPRPRFSVMDQEPHGLQLIRNDIKVSLCMIVRNNAETIRPCLESICRWVDEVIVVDTGSTDNTPEICRELGAKVYFWAWRDDFSAARNESLRHARGEWIFWMDSDDTIPEVSGRKLRALVDQDHEPSIMGYVMQVHCPGQGDEDQTIVDHIKLFRNRPDLQFEFRIHEQIIPAIRRAGGDVAWTDIYVVHSGSDRSPEAQARKRERDFRILQQEIGDRPDHPFALFNLGMTYADAAQHDQAIQYLSRCISVSGSEESHLPKAYSLLVSSLTCLNQLQEASDACQRGIRQFPQDRELLFRQATLNHTLGHLEAAASGYQKLLHERFERRFSSIDEGVYGYKARHNLAMVLEELGSWEGACKAWKEITLERPAYRLGWRGLGRALRILGRITEHVAIEQSLALSSQDGIKAESFLLCANRLELEQKHAAAIEVFQNAVQAFPRDLDLHQEWCRFAFSNATLSVAAGALEKLTQLAPHDPSAYHNLGSVMLQMGELENAINAFERSLELRPGNAVTKSLLDLARQQDQNR